MSVSAGIAGAAAGSTAASSAQATTAKKIACQSIVSSFDSKTATIQESQTYASCIQLLHPSEMSGAEVIAIKVLIVVALLGAAFGFWRGDGFSHKQTFVDRLLCGFCGLFLAPIFIIIIGAVIRGVIFLFE